MRQVLGPLRTAHRNTTPAISGSGRWWSRTTAGKRGWTGPPAAARTPERFFPAFGEQLKAAEAKAICASCEVRDHCLELAVKAAGGLDQDHGVFGGTLPGERSPLRGNRFPEPSAYLQQRELAEAAHALTGEVGLRQAARQLGIHRDALRAAFAQWGLPALERRVGWQPSRFLADRGEAERAYALAERLGRINAVVQELGTTWPSLRKPFSGTVWACPHATRRPSSSGRPATPLRI